MSDVMAVCLEDAVAVTVNPPNGKDPAGPFCALQATSSGGTATVLTARGRTTTVYIPLGAPLYLAVKGVISLGGAAGVVGFLASPYTGSQQ